MVKLICLLTGFLLICLFKYSSCFEWISVKSGDRLSKNVVALYSKIYVGRTKYLNTMQLASVYIRNIYEEKIADRAVVKLNTNEIVRYDEFEVLVATEKCEWVLFEKNFVPEDMVRGGTSWNLEPVYVGKQDDKEIASIFLTSNKVQSSARYIYQGPRTIYALVCKNNNKWVEATTINVPENSVSIEEYPPGYVARLLGSVSYVPGIVFPESNQTYITYNGNYLESFNIEVLVDDSQKYSWQTVTSAIGIPENAVVCGVSDNNELTYISKRYSQSARTKVFPISFSEAYNVPFDILIDNTK